MKKYLLSLLLTLFMFNSHGSVTGPTDRINKLLRFIANSSMLREGALYYLIAHRCNRYLSYDESFYCRQALKKQIAILDYDIVFTDEKKVPPKDAWGPDAFVFVAFKQTLISTLSDPRTTLYLNEIKQGLNDFLSGANLNFNIWDNTLAFYGSPLLAARTIAALFQDTSTIKLHLAYLEKTGTRGKLAFDENRGRLSEIIDTINLILDYSENNYRDLFYPAPLRDQLYRNIYHFYVPLYLAMALAADKTPYQFALAAPMMMTLTYEFVTLAEDYRYLWKDPARLDVIHDIDSLKDIFAGFSGGAFGIGRNVAPGHFVLMKESFNRSTEEGVNFLLYSAN